LTVSEPRPTAPTITDVARRAGVSKGLVSFVFNGRPGVAAETRARILRAADDLRWRPSPHARTLSRQMAYAMGLVIRRQPAVLASDPFFPAFLAGVETVLGEAGRVLVLSVVPDIDAEERTYRSLADDRRVDGVFVTDLGRDDHRFDLLRELRLPAVSLGRAPDSSASVRMDDTAGIGQAVDHLAGLGHARIAHVAGDPTMVHGWRRRVAFQTAMAARDLDPGMIADTDFSAAAGAGATVSLIGRRHRPTAIVYASDPMAIAGLGALSERGIDVPAEMSLTGYDGTELAHHVHPRLTTVETDPALWGATAARALLTLVIDGRADHLDLPAGRLVPGGSTAQPPPSQPL
jgi:DNA-binding LacI/PurR family transcriptional regulator